MDIAGAYTFEGVLPSHINTISTDNMANLGVDFGANDIEGCPFGMNDS